MCGIIGIVRPLGASCAEGLQAGLERLRHRGPDRLSALDIDGVAAFGHARLSILDLSSAADQPMRDRSGRYVLTYNGEVYNFKAIRQELEMRGHRFQSSSDTEVVITAYAEWGVNAFARFDGMFALGIWDTQQRLLVLARDRFGEKPLYYAVDNGWVLFASELQALLAIGRLQAKPPSIVAWSDYLALGYIPGPTTAHPDVLKVEPATYLEITSNTRVRATRYWDYAAAFRRKSNASDAEQTQELSLALRRAVRSQLVSDVPVGAFLSGGLDSSTIVALMEDALPYPLHTFSVGFEPSQYDEAEDAQRVASHCRTIHHAYRIGLLGGGELARRASALYDEPFSDTSLVPMAAVSEEAARFVKVVLSGDGSDEIFAGYATYRADRMMGVLRHVPRIARAAAARVATTLVKEELSRKTTWRFKLRQFAKGLSRDPQEAHSAWRELHSTREIIDQLGRSHAEEIQAHPPSRIALRHYAEVEDLASLDQHLYVDAKTWLVDDILFKVDRASMASSLEARVPFLDREVVELAARLPVHLKLGPRNGKVALRRIATRLLPPETLRKKKAGFSAPINAWFGWAGDNEYKNFNSAVREWWNAREELSSL